MSFPTPEAMVFIWFPHPILYPPIGPLEQGHPPLDQGLVQFRAAAGTTTQDWTVLFNWLGKHPYQPWNEPVGAYKCWYSESEISGKRAKEVEHFRPKGVVTVPSSTTRVVKELDAQLPGWRDWVEFAGIPYPWLEWDERNYRLASPHVNGSGSKGSLFPVLNGSARLTERDSFHTQPTLEQHILLDPAQPGDADCLLVTSQGRIEAAFDGDFDQSLPLQDQWDTDAMRALRAKVSIIIYELNDSDFIRARSKQYEKTTQYLLKLSNSIHGEPQSAVQHFMDEIIISSRSYSFYSLSARSAIQDFILTVPNSPIADLLGGILQSIRSRETPPRTT